MKVYFKRVHEDAVLPEKAHNDDAGLDLFSLEDIVIAPWSRMLVRTGIAWVTGFYKDSLYLHIQPRSSLAVQGIDIGAGIVDKGYRNEIKVLLINNTGLRYTINENDKIAQAIIYRLPDVEVEEINEINETARGLGGFGSTGR